MTTERAADDAVERRGKRQGRVQSVERALDLLDQMADAGGVATLSDLAERTELPPPTIHRLMATLREAGFVRREQSRQYALGAKLVGLGESAERLLGSWVRPTLARLVERTGETANMAMLDGDRVVYVAQVPSKHTMRMFTEVGRRVGVHCTAVGKALVAGLDDETVRGMLRRGGMDKHTPNTLTSEDEFFSHLAQIRRLGYAFDEAEQEMGVRCVAAATSSSTPIALSVSGPAARFSRERRDAVIPVLLDAVGGLAEAD